MMVMGNIDYYKLQQLKEQMGQTHVSTTSETRRNPRSLSKRGFAAEVNSEAIRNNIIQRQIHETEMDRGTQNNPPAPS